RVLALNKADLLDPDFDASTLASVDGARAVLTSAATGLGIAELLEAVAAALERPAAYADEGRAAGRTG
ncbi:MAG: hypothetical protein J4N28_05310, partial [Chloroflexi bacterium]|nr:hypothetical protein [Chloroflexota bacterium]